ncbi:chromatin remodeling protein EBS-like [Bidens hawaiensis]|uniref:chromatin remodeling protein EBS-like n=1 Tax=Bidens hawaiensis TaxID=980011 RepID=UPI004049CE20
MSQQINPRKGDLNSFTIAGTNITIKADDCILLRSSNGNIDYVARVLQVNEGSVKIRWYYRPEETREGRKRFHGKKEVLLSNHTDTQTTGTIQGKCVVHSYEDYIQLERAGVDDYFCRFEYDAAKKRVVRIKSLYCECNMPYNPDEFMVQCDGCKRWFHPRCKNMTNKRAKQLEEFFCSTECSNGDANASEN